MRILVASPILPWPLNTGGNAGVFSTLHCLAEDHQFTFVCPIYYDHGIEEAKELQAQLPLVKFRAVFCGANRSKSNLTLRGARWLVRCGRRILTPLTQHPARPEVPYYPFNPLPEPFLTAIGEEISRGVDLFQAEFAEMMPMGAWVPAEIPKVFDHLQIHFVYAQRFLAARGRNSYASYMAAIMRVQEHAYLQSFHGVMTMSETDREALLPFVSAEKLFTSPLPIPSDVGIARDIDPNFDNRFTYVASEEHFPNRDGLEWLLAEVWPEIRKQLPSSTLNVIGRWTEAARSQLATPGLNFTGFVPDLPAALRGSIMLVPLRIGSGIRIKILAALAQGVPVVSTSVGCEGLLVTDGTDLLIRDDSHQFAAAAVSLAQDPGFRLRLASAGRDSVSKHYSQQEVRRRRNEIYEAVLEIARSKRIAN
jgi:glycosyltransferase involved in cell wall biosynthesis